MNQAYENIIQRQSVRQYSDKKVPRELLEQIVQAGQFAPTGKNRQPLAFVVVDDPKRIQELSKLNAEVMQSKGDPFYNAQALIIVLAKTEAPTYVYDGSLAMANLMLAANALGVHSCWIHRAKEVFSTPEGKALLKKWGLDDSYEGIGNCILGYAAKDLPKRSPRTSKVVWDS